MQKAEVAALICDLPIKDRKIYGALVAAADAGRPAPTCDDLLEVSGYSAVSSTVGAVQRLVLSRLKDEVEADIADLFDDEGKLLPVWEWPLVWRQGLISGIEVEELWEGRGEDRVQVGMLRKVKISDRLKRIELIGKHIGVQAFKERVEVDATEDLAALLSRARERAIGDS